AVVQTLDQSPARNAVAEKSKPHRSSRPRRRTVVIGWAVAASALIAIMLFPAVRSYREAARRMQSSNHFKQIGSSFADVYDSSGSMHQSTTRESGAARAYAAKVPPPDQPPPPAPQDGSYQRMTSKNDRIPALGYEEKMNFGNPVADPAK